MYFLSALPKILQIFRRRVDHAKRNPNVEDIGTLAKFITRHEEIIMDSKVVLAVTSTDYFGSKLLVSS